MMLRDYAQAHDLFVVGEHVDNGWSGTNYDRPGFQRMIDDIEDGKINCVVTKDLSRLGRNYILTGQYTDVVFPSLGCRFIALNDRVKTIHKNNEMLVILKNMMNDSYARDTSNKIRAVKQSTFKSGKYVGCYAPIGHLKNPEDKHVLVIDPVTAPVVIHIFIFDLRCQGYSYRKIATTLNTENVPTPTTFYYMRQGKPNIRKDGNWGHRPQSRLFSATKFISGTWSRTKLATCPTRFTSRSPSQRVSGLGWKTPTSR